MIRLPCRRRVVADARADGLCQRLRLFCRAVGEQDIHLSALRRGARERAAHVACADKTDLHIVVPLS